MYKCDHFACVCMHSDVFVCVMGLAQKLLSFLSEGFAESMLYAHEKVFICKLCNVNFHILLAFITQLMVLWVTTLHRMSLSSTLGDYASRLLGLWIWENYTT